MDIVRHGLYLDGRASGQPDGYFIDAKNVNFDKVRGMMSNEEGFELSVTSIKVGTTTTVSTALPSVPIGKTQVDATRVVLFLVQSDGLNSEIGIYYNSGMYERIVIDNGFYFSMDHPIQARSKIRNGQVIVSWTDNNNNPCILNLDDLPFDVTATRTLVTATDIEFIKIWPTTNTEATLTVTQVNNAGGNILSGALHFFYWYKTDSGQEMGYSLPTPPVTITKASTADWTQTTGIEAGTMTTRSVSLQMAGMDTRFERICFGVIKVVEDIVSIYKFSENDITSSTIDIMYTGFDTETAIPIADFYTSVAPYNTAKTVFTTNDNKLGFGGLTGLVDIGYQKYANNIRIKPVRQSFYHTTESLNYGKNSTYLFGNRSFRAGEVYALYVGFQLTDGTKTFGYHIPGRVKSGVAAIGGNTEDTLVSSIMGTYPWLKSDNSIGSGVRYFHTRDYGDMTLGNERMSYWQNENEFYADEDDAEIWDSGGYTGATLAGQNVRHHRFPSMYGDGSNEHNWYDPGSRRTYIYGVQLENVYIPPAIASRVESVFLYYAERSTMNCTMLTQSLMHQSLTQTFSMIPFDMMSDIYPLTATYIKKDVTMTPRDSVWKDGAPYGTGSPYRYQKHDFLDTTGTVCNIDAISREYRQIRAIKDLAYSPDIVDTTSMHGRRIGGLMVNTQGGGGPISEPWLNSTQAGTVLNVYYGSPDFGGWTIQRLTLASLCIFRTDMYISYKSQNLVCAGRVALTGTTSSYIFQGDVFNCDYAYRILGSELGGTDPNDPNESRRDMYWFPCQSNKNINLRHTLVTDDSEDNYFYPKDNGESGFTYIKRDIEAEVNIFYCDNTYSRKNKDHGVTPLPKDSISITDFMNRIILSESSNEEENVESWAQFLPNNSYDMPSKERIVNIESIGDELIINTERNLYKTIGNKNMKVDEVTVYIGSGDVFDMQPQQQILSDDGYAGCTSQWSCLKVPSGYIYVNQDRGKVFMYDGQLKEISSLGCMEWFRDNLPSTLKKQMMTKMEAINFNFDNPIKTVGVICEFDTKYNRLIIGYRDYTLKTAITTVEGDDITTSFMGAYNGLSVDGITYYNDNSYGLEGMFHFEYALLGCAPQDFYLGDTRYFDEVTWTKTFSFNTNEWRSFHTYKPMFIFKNDYALFSVPRGVAGSIYKHNIEGTYGVYYTSDKNECFAEFVINAGQDYSTGGKLTLVDNKLFDSIYWMTEVMEGNKHRYDKTFGKIMIYNENQCSGIIDLNDANTYNTDGTWNFNSFKDIVIDYASAIMNAEKGVDTGDNSTSDKMVYGNINPNKRWYDMNYFHGKYIVVRLIYDNVDQYELFMRAYGGYIQRCDR